MNELYIFAVKSIMMNEFALNYASQREKTVGCDHWNWNDYKDKYLHVYMQIFKKEQN